MKTFCFLLLLCATTSLVKAQQPAQKIVPETAAKPVAVSTIGNTKSGGAVSSSYAAGRAVKTGDSAKSGKQTQGATFGEKVSSGLHAAGNIVAQGAGAKIADTVVTKKQ